MNGPIASARLRNLVAIVINRLKNNKESLVLLVGKGVAIGTVITLSEMVGHVILFFGVKVFESFLGSGLFNSFCDLQVTI